MEYYNRFTKDYKRAVQSPHKRLLMRIELLSTNEGTIGEITKDMLIDVQGQININYNQLVRRSVSLTVTNVNQKYVPSVNNMIWYNRKFKIWIGVVAENNDIYWWSQGVFYTKSATGNAHTISIEGIDKGGALDGTLKTNLSEVQYIVKAGTSIKDLILDTLALNAGSSAEMLKGSVYYGASMPIDPVAPIVDMRYNTQVLKADLSVDANNYLGNLFTSLANGYGADIYYDTNGHLRLEPLADIFLVDGYKYMAHQWDFTDLSGDFAETNYTYNMDGCNAVTVYTNLSVETAALINAQNEAKQETVSDDEPTDDEEEEEEEVNDPNIYYTAYNLNPISPLRVGAVGLRRMQSVEIDYIDTTESDMKSRCEQYAVMLLHKESLRGMSVTFNCPIIPHLDVNKTIGLTDRYQKIESGTFVIGSITIPLGTGTMNVSATNIQWLPVDYQIDGTFIENSETIGGDG